MGSLVSIMVANLVMEYIEEKALSIHFHLHLFFGNTMLMMFVLLSIKILAFLEHLNSIHPSVQFIHEMENSNKCLPFLDVLL